MLHEFLNAQLLPITEDSNFEKLKKSAEDVTKKLNKNKAKILSYTLAALDPEIPADNPNLLEVKEIMTKNWNTFTINSKDTPVTFIRAVMLEALEIVSKETTLAPLIWLTGRNIQKYYKFIGKEKELITGFLLALGQDVESKARESWSLSSENKLEKLSLEIKEITGAVLDRETLQKKMEDASGPSKSDGSPNFPDPNPVWTNSPQNWSYNFAPRAAKGISEVVNKALKEQAKELSFIQSRLQETVSKFLAEVQTDFFEKSSLLSMRTQLLWWKESCYSESLNKSYRGQNTGLLQILLAYDYSLFVPTLYPASVDYFLRETHRILVEDENKKIKLSEILKQIEISKEEIKKIVAEPAIEQGRISLLSFIKGFIWGKYTAKQIKDFIGVADNSDLTLADFTIWLFHDFQSVKIVINK